VVTGATGYLGSHCVQQLLDEGYKVRGTVRDKSNAEKVDFLYSVSENGDNLELVDADLLIPGSFAVACQGADYVFHVASPFFYSAKNPEVELINPAVDGTLNVLQSCVDQNVKKVILTSSHAAVQGDPEKYGQDYLFSEKDWNTTSTIKGYPYALSKRKAERAAWNFAYENHLNLVVINPGLLTVYNIWFSESISLYNILINTGFILGPPLGSRPDGTSVSKILT